MKKRLLTALHFSDVQFGINHEYRESQPYDTLFERMTPALEKFRALPTPPSVVLFSGDLAEWGLRHEFKKGAYLLERIAGLLDLRKSRVCIIPGNHDVHHRYCASQIEYERKFRKDLQPPWWEGYLPYAEMFQDFYKGEKTTASFTEQEPYSWFEYPELQLVVMGLNSTLLNGPAKPETVAGDWPVRQQGHLGEVQLRWFRERLKRIPNTWLILGLVHHHLRRGDDDDMSHIVEHTELKAFLGSRVHLLIHGHIHRCVTDSAEGLPCISAGAASLKTEVRFPGEPNQIQLLHFSQDSVVREMWKPNPKNPVLPWVVDNTIGQSGNGREEIPLNHLAPQPEPAPARIISHLKDWWRTKDGTAERMMRSMQSIYEREHKDQTFHRRCLTLEVFAHSLDPQSATKLDLVRFSNEFLVETNGCQCHLVGVNWGDGNSTAGIGTIAIDLMQGGAPPIGCSIEWFPLPAKDNDPDTLRRTLIWFTPALPKSQESYVLTCQQELASSMAPLVAGKTDTLRLTPTRAKGIVERVDLVLHAPKSVARSLEFFDVPSGAKVLGHGEVVEDKNYKAPEGFESLMVRGEKRDAASAFQVGIRWKAGLEPAREMA